MKTSQYFNGRNLVGLLAVGMFNAGVAMGGPVGEYGIPAQQTESLGDLVTIGVGFIGSYTGFDLEEEYFSGPAAVGAAGTALWKADYDDPDGWLYGIMGSATFPTLRNATIDGRYQTGELEGGFRIVPLAGGNSFRGEADIDRDLWQVGLSVPLFEWIYGRVEYVNQEDDVDWKYSGGGVEKQEYDIRALRFGLGAKQDVPVGASGFNVTLDVFAGAVYFDLEHTEKTVPVTTDWEGWGYVLRGGASAAYPLNDQFSVVGGVAFEWMDLSDDGLDFENWMLDLVLGISGTF